MKKLLSIIFLTLLFSNTVFSDDVIYEYSEKLSNKELSSNQIVEICKEYESKNIDLGQYDQATFNTGRGIENYCATMKMRAEFKTEAEYDYVQKGWSKINLEQLDFKYLSNKFFKLEIPKNKERSCEIDIVNEKRVSLYEISRRCGVEKIITYEESMEEPKCTSEECNLVKIEYDDVDSLKNNWINIIDHFFADANNDGYMDLVIRFQKDGAYSMGAQTMTAAVTSFQEANKTQLNSFKKRYVDQSVTYGEYLSKCSKYGRSYPFTRAISNITEVEVFTGENLDVDCLVKKFEEHQKTYPVKSFLSDKFLKPQKIILNKETSKSLSNNITYEKYEMSSFVDQKCSENCVYTTEALIIHKNKYWYIKGTNDRGLKAEMNSNDDLLITNLMSTHKRKYNYYDTNIVRVGDNVITSFAKDQNVYLNACGADPQFYYDKPLNIKNIVTEVPNRITKLEKSKYDRAFKTIANSTINLDGNKIDISVSNFRDLMIRDNNGNVLATRKISGASSLYELKHKGKVVAWGVGWNQYCETINPDFTALRIFIPVKKDNKISIEQQLTKLNVNPFYKATLNSEKLIISDAVTISGSSNAANYYYQGQKFYELDHVNGFKSIDTYVELHEKIDVLQISPARMVNILAGFYETEILNKYTRANFDNIYKDLLANYHWNLYYEFGDNIFQSNLASSIDDLDISDEIKNAFRAFEKREIKYRQFPPIVWEIPNLKKNCFKQDNYETLKELARNCYLFHSSYIMEYGFDDVKWFAVQTEFKDSYELINNDKDKRFEEFLDYQIQNMKSFVWEDLGMDGTVVDELLSIFQRANGGYTKSKDNRYVVISGCEYKNCTKKGLVFIDTKDDYTIALIRHQSYQPDKTDSAVESDDWLILSQAHDEYKFLPKEFFDAVTEWRLIEGQVVGDDPLPMPRIIRFVGGYSDEMQVLYNSDDYKERNDRKGWLGVRIRQVDKDDTSVVVIDTVSDDGPAYQAGVKSGDIILSMNKSIIVTKEGLLYELSKLKADQIVDFKIIRGGKRIDLNVKLGAK
ncbi:PDZ domain-containing protein [Candidatus Pelagibacter sp.]|nr:PDZ domain-containing protein [Candidatus Pelagibacter sp.]